MRTIGTVAAIVATVLTAGCAPTGDFGRPKQSFFNDTIVPEMRGFVREVRGVITSRYELSGDEHEMRSLSYSLMHPDEKPSLHKTLSHALNESGVSSGYYERHRRVDHIAGTPPYEASGPARRVNNLISLIKSDTTLLRRFAAVTDRVYRSDALRRKSLARGRDLAADDILDTTARIEENRQVAADTLLGMENRVDDYWIDLRRSVLEYPETRERYVARLIRRLSLEVDELGARLNWHTRPDKGSRRVRARRSDPRRAKSRAAAPGTPELLGGPRR